MAKKLTLEVRESSYHGDHFVVSLAIDGKIEKFRGCGRFWYYFDTYEYKNRIIKIKQIRLFLEKWWSQEVTRSLDLEKAKPVLHMNINRMGTGFGCKDTGEYND